MRNTLLLFAMLASTFALAQQKVIIKAGTPIPVQSEKSVKAADVHEGETINFRVTTDIKADGVTIIERGSIVKGKVTEAKKSTIAGTKGRLVINLTSMNLTNGDPLYFTDSTVRIYGKNRTPVAVATACIVWPCIFICGTKAEMPAGYETTAIVANNTEISVK